MTTGGEYGMTADTGDRGGRSRPPRAPPQRRRRSRLLTLTPPGPGLLSPGGAPGLLVRRAHRLLGPEAPPALALGGQPLQPAGLPEAGPAGAPARRDPRLDPGAGPQQRPRGHDQQGQARQPSRLRRPPSPRLHRGHLPLLRPLSLPGWTFWEKSQHSDKELVKAETVELEFRILRQAESWRNRQVITLPPGLAEQCA